MKFKKKISVIIPCYNEENLIAEVIENSTNSLNNLECSFEIIVVDDFQMTIQENFSWVSR